MLSLRLYPTPSLFAYKEQQPHANLLRTLQNNSLLCSEKAEICVSAAEPYGVAISLHVLQLVWFLKQMDSPKAPQEIRITICTDKVSLGELNWQSEEGGLLPSSEGCAEQSFSFSAPTPLREAMCRQGPITREP